MTGGSSAYSNISLPRLRGRCPEGTDEATVKYVLTIIIARTTASLADVIASYLGDATFPAGGEG